MLKKYLPYILAVLFAYFCFYQVSMHIVYQLCQLEHENLFVEGMDVFMDSFGQIGGLGEWITLWATQFFAFWGWGSWCFIMPVLFTFVAVAFLLPIKKVWSFPIAVCVALAQLLSMYDYTFSWAGSVSFSLSICCLFLITRVKSDKWRILLFCIGIPMVLWLFGSVAIVYLLAGVCLLVNRRNWKYAIPIPVAIYILMVGWFYQKGLAASFESLMKPDFYCDSNIEFLWLHYMEWVMLVLSILLSRLSHTMTIRCKIAWYSINSCLWVLPCGLFMKYAPSLTNPYDQVLYRLNHYAYTEKWDSILRLLSVYQMDNWIFMNYANLALAQKGQLADLAFIYKPHGRAALLVNPNPSGLIRMMKSDVNYAVGCIAEAQHQAFDAQVGYHKALGIQTLKRLVQTNLIFGHYEVADKYLGLIEKTTFYKDWAEKYKPFLYNDEAVSVHPELGEKRKSLVKDNRFALVHGWTSELEDIVRMNPKNKKAVEYLGLSHLLGNDRIAFQQFLKQNYSDADLTYVPLAFQQAIVLWYDEECWESYHVEQKLVDEYKCYNEWYEKNKNRSNLKEVMNAEFGHTFWYYSMFK